MNENLDSDRLPSTEATSDGKSMEPLRELNLLVVSDEDSQRPDENEADWKDEHEVEEDDQYPALGKSSLTVPRLQRRSTRRSQLCERMFSSDLPRVSLRASSYNSSCRRFSQRAHTKRSLSRFMSKPEENSAPIDWSSQGRTTLSMAETYLQCAMEAIKPYEVSKNFSRLFYIFYRSCQWRWTMMCMSSILISLPFLGEEAGWLPLTMVQSIMAGCTVVFGATCFLEYQVITDHGTHDFVSGRTLAMLFHILALFANTIALFFNRTIFVTWLNPLILFVYFHSFGKLAALLLKIVVSVSSSLALLFLVITFYAFVGLNVSDTQTGLFTSFPGAFADLTWISSGGGLFPNIMLPQYLYHPARVSLYFVSFIAIVNYLILNIVLGMIYNKYVEFSKDQYSANVKFRGDALKLAFEALDTDKNGRVIEPKLALLLKHMRPNYSASRLGILMDILFPKSEETLTERTFPRVLTAINLHVRQIVSKHSSDFKQRVADILASREYYYYQLGLAIVQILLLLAFITYAERNFSLGTSSGVLLFITLSIVALNVAQLLGSIAFAIIHGWLGLKRNWLEMMNLVATVAIIAMVIWWLIGSEGEVCSGFSIMAVSFGDYTLLECGLNGTSLNVTIPRGPTALQIQPHNPFIIPDHSLTMQDFTCCQELFDAGAAMELATTIWITLGGLNVVKILGAWAPYRKLFRSFKLLLPLLPPFLGIYYTIMHVYALMGVYIWGDLITPSNPTVIEVGYDSDGTAIVNNFNSYSKSFVTLLTLHSVGGFQELSELQVAFSGQAAFLYTFSFYIVMSLIFLNAFVGFFINIFMSKCEEEAEYLKIERDGTEYVLFERRADPIHVMRQELGISLEDYDAQLKNAMNQEDRTR